MRIGCTITPTPDAPQLARVAEDLGYARVWVNDSPALYPDVWMTLARMSEQTERIGLGPAVLVPGLRHPLTTASAIATLEALAPGRTAAVVGSGFTGRLAVGKRPASWPEIERFVGDVRTFLRGESVESDSGQPMRMMHPPHFVAARPVQTPIFVAATGPKGLAIAGRIGDGVVSIKVPHHGFAHCIVSINGTVLRDGEDLGSERVLRAAGPGVAVAYHVAYALRGVAAVSAMPLGAEWVAQYEQLDPNSRQLALHEGHHASVNGRDRMLMTADALRRSSFTGDEADLRQRLRDLEMGGATEVTYHPSSDAAVDELTAFATMARLAGGEAKL